MKNEKSDSLTDLVTGSILVLLSIRGTYGEQSGLPVPVNGGLSNASPISELTSPNLHTGIDVGHASATLSPDGHKLTIHQTTDKTVLDWQSFDIAAGNKVQYVQPNTTSIALNNIHQVDASKIFGNLSANGQVYLVNANGFVFGNGSSVNTNTLVATTLKITDDVFQKGITKVVDANVSNSNLQPVAALSGDGSVYRDTGNGNREKITILVEKAAAITADKGGRVILAAPGIQNKGTITAADGQVILAAATDKVYLQETDAENLRGLLVEVQTGGDVKNVGKILTERGNTTMLGFAVSQEGITSASTSVDLNGSVRLLAREGAKLTKSDNNTYKLLPDSTVRDSASDDGLGTQSTLALAGTSKTSVDLDNSSGTAVDGQAQPKSSIELAGGRIMVKSGAKVTAQGGNIDLIASAAPDQPLNSTTDSNSSKIVLESGSLLDVSGVKNIQKTMASNIVNVELRNDELRDAPIQKTGILHGKTIAVDTRKGTSIADMSGAVAKIQHTVTERNSTAGAVNLQSEGNALVSKGAKIDISGGSVHYKSGVVSTSQLLSDGVLYDMANADPSLTYQKIVSNKHFEPGYYQGSDAGAVNIKSRDLVLDGAIDGSTKNGLYQRQQSDWTSNGLLSIDTVWSHLQQQDVVLGNKQTYTTLGADQAITSPIYLSNALFSLGLNRLTVASGGKLTIAKNANLKIANAGQLSLQAGEIDVQGSVYAPSGQVQLKTQTNLDPARTLSGQLHIAGNSRIDASGLWINDTKDNQASDRLLLPGGNIDLQAQGDLILDAKSSLEANGGGWLNNSYKLTAGSGGNISLSTAGLRPSQLKVDAQLSAFGLNNGGQLALTATAIAVTNAAASNDSITLNLAPELLSSGGFGSYALTANAGNLSIADTTQIKLQQQNWLLKPNALSTTSGSELAPLVVRTLLPDDTRKPANLSLSVAHNATISGGYYPERQISVGKNANITADIDAILSLNSDSNIVIDGSLQAPSGEIDLNITLPPTSIDKGYNPNQAIVLNDNAKLNTAGTALMTNNAAGLNLGDVKAGGNITMNADRGYIITAPKSNMDVSGTSAVLDIVNSQGISRQTIASNGGNITMSAAEGLILQGQMLAKAGTGSSLAGTQSTAGGGSLSLELNAQQRNEPEGVVFTTTDRIIHVSAQPNTNLNLNNWATTGIPPSLNGSAFISAQQIKSAGFDSLLLKSSVLQPTQYESSPVQPERGEIRFDGDVQLSLKQNLDLDAPLLSYFGNNTIGQVLLTANTLSLGSSWNQTAQGNLTAVTGKPVILSLSANNIDLRGAAEIKGFTETQLNSSGDIRLLGVNPNNEKNLIGNLALSGNLTLSAREVFPSAYSQFKIAIDSNLNPDGKITINANSAIPYTPLSAAGKIEIQAANIINKGNLLAPFGNINLNADKFIQLASGSQTSVSASDATVIPFGRSQGNLDWIYPLGLYSNIQAGTPQKTITLAGPKIDLADGAKVNLNGGGDLSTFEFIPGPGGSIDVLDAKSTGYQQNYAILPKLGSSYAAYDALEFPTSGLKTGDSIYLSADAGVKAGNYVLLPAHYALLPGAYLVTPQQKTTDMAAGTRLLRSDGAQIVAGYRYTAGTDVADSRWSGFAVEPGAVATTRSEYQQTTASQFFKGATSALPQDAGNLSLSATQQLNLAAKISATAATGGLGGMLDISANNLTVVEKNPAVATNGQINLLASQLNNLGVDSILLGGRRTRTTDNTQLRVSAQSVLVAGGVHLKVPEIFLAASDSINIANGADISAVGTPSKTDTELSISNASTTNSDGAIVRVSNAPAATINRDNALLSRQTGTLTVAADANLSADGSIYLDASKNNSFQGNIAMPKGTLTLSSSMITLGGTDTSTGLNLSESTLNSLQVDSLTLNSYSSVNLASTLDLHFKSLTLDATSINGYAAAGQVAILQADNITVQNLNTSASDSATKATGTGSLLLQANTINLASGSYAIDGFQHIDLKATGKVNNIGTSTIGIDSDLALSTPLWTAESGANTTLNLGAHGLTTSGSGNTIPTTELGARLTVNAEEINHQGHIELASGAVNFHATNNLRLAANSIIDTSGRVIPMATSTLTADAGSVNLSADKGDLVIAPNATINLSAAKKGGNAGSLSLMATQGNLSLSGSNISALAYSGGIGGSFNATSLNPVLNNFSSLNSYLSQHGFNKTITIRQSLSDLIVAKDDVMKANNISLTTDTGALSVFGKLDVSGKQAGKINLVAGDAVILNSGSQLNAVSQGDKTAGGKVTLTSINPDADTKQGVSIAPGASVNVSGSDASFGGSVNIVVNRLSNNDAAVSIAANSVTGAKAQNIVAMAQSVDTALSNTQIQQWRNETQSFMDNAQQNTGLQTRLAGFVLQPGLDIQSSTNTTLDLSDSIIKNTWQQSSTSQIWTTTLTDVAGAPSSVQQISTTGVIRNLTAANTKLLTSDGSFYFDSNPNSPTFRQLFVRIFANTGSTIAAKYNPTNIKGNLVEHNGWDFELPYQQDQNWRFGAQQVPGFLSLRSAGDLSIQQKLNDGFALYDADQLAGLLGAKANWLPTQVLQTRPSWSFNLVAGADLHSANLTDVQADTAIGNLTLGSNVNVRTGTGDISATAAGDIKLTDWTSSIYTAGRATDGNRYGSFSNNFVTTNFFVEYPIDGGDLTVKAGGNIIGAPSAQLMSDWLQRTGNWDSSNGVSSADTATAWGIDFDSLVVQNSTNARIQNLKFGFRENLGALGGGDVIVQSGKSIQDLSVMLPTSAKPVGKLHGNGLITENVWQQQGGGNLKISAEGNIAGGVFYVDQGSADITAKGAITGGSQYTSGPIFALGDSQFSINAGAGIAVGSILNPLTLTEPKFLDKASYFSTYSANSSVMLQSLAGDVSLNNDTGIILKEYKIFDQTSPKGRSVLGSASYPLLTLYPGNLSAHALSGGLQVNNSLSLFSSANSSLDLRANADISFGNILNGFTLNQLDAAPANLLSPASPNTNINSAVQYLYTSPINGDTSLVHATTPVHQQDTEHNQIISNQGSITGVGVGVVKLALAKVTDIVAALDMTNVGLQVQNLRDNDITNINVGRDILYPLQRDITTGAVQGSSGGIELAGPGLLAIWAGRHIDLGSSDGITSVGALLNPALPNTGADITVLAGNPLNKGMQSLTDFLNYYTQQTPYQDVAPLLHQQSSNNGRLQIALGMLFAEIRSAAKAATTSTGTAQQTAYQRGYDAIARLFPNSPSGDIKLFFSRIQTLEGGNINLLAPGGMVNAGLASAFTGQKDPAQLGIVAQRQGDINVLVKGDLQVNQSRIFSLDSGNITAWSSEGNIDAGRGAKSAIATPRPKVSIDANGNLTVEFPATVSGSGIRAQSGFNNDHIGDVTLAAPKGVIDAGEAGIGGKNVIIASPTVIGASNIQSLGTSFGLATSTSTIALPSNTGNAVAAVSKVSNSIDTITGDDFDKTQQQNKSVKVAFLDAQVIGFGNCSIADVKADKPGCGRSN